MQYKQDVEYSVIDFTNIGYQYDTQYDELLLEVGNKYLINTIVNNKLITSEIDLEDYDAV